MTDIAGGNEIARGLEGIVLTETRLSKVEGHAGRLTIGGFPVEELAPNATYEEVLYLLWYDRLPKKDELDALRAQMVENRALPEATMAILQAAAERQLPPMDGLRMGVDTLSLVDPDPADNSKEANLRRAIGLVAHIPTIVATYWWLLKGQEPIEPKAELGHVANFLYMMNGEDPHPAEVRGLQTYVNTVVDHGMNASTFTSRVIVSTQSDMVSAIVGAIGALKGPLHGGAPGPALDTVYLMQERSAESGRDIREEAEDWAREFVNGGGRIMGFGHRVYKVRDPRAEVLGAAATRLFERAGDTKLNEDARACEDVFVRVLEELKPGRGLQTNVEFYTALVLHGVGLHSDLFSSIFALSRVGGWTSHVLEQIEDNILIRPRAKYVGELDRKWVPLEER